MNNPVILKLEIDTLRTENLRLSVQLSVLERKYRDLERFLQDVRFLLSSDLVSENSDGDWADNLRDIQERGARFANYAKIP